MVETQTNVIRTVVSVEDLRDGDTVEVEGIFRTVSTKHIKRNDFFGCYTFEGSRFPKGITKIVFKVDLGNGEYRYTQ